MCDPDVNLCPHTLLELFSCLIFAGLNLGAFYSCTHALFVYLHHLVLGSYKKYAWAIDPNADPQRSLVLAAAAAANDGPLNLS